VKRKLGGAAVLMAAAALAAAACTSTASTTHTGTEAISGTATNQAALASPTSFPVKLTGVVNTNGTIFYDSSANTKAAKIETGKGVLALTHTAGTTSQKLLSTTTCMFEVTVHRTFNVVGDKSTGTFKGATGTGAVTFVMTADLPKLTNGTCDESTTAHPVPATARLTLAAKGPITITAT
jgi:hypothetical protein